jgi:hypothetical protein
VVWDEHYFERTGKNHTFLKTKWDSNLSRFAGKKIRKVWWRDKNIWN